MDSFKYTTIGHGRHALCSPVSLATVDYVLVSLGLASGGRLLDAGCGKAEMLIRAAEQYGAGGVGMDVNRSLCTGNQRRRNE